MICTLIHTLADCPVKTGTSTCTNCGAGAVVVRGSWELEGVFHTASQPWSMLDGAG